MLATRVVEAWGSTNVEIGAVVASCLCFEDWQRHCVIEGQVMAIQVGVGRCQKMTQNVAVAAVSLSFVAMVAHWNCSLLFGNGDAACLWRSFTTIKWRNRKRPPCAVWFCLQTDALVGK